MNLSALNSPFELTHPWGGIARRVKAPKSNSGAHLTDLQRRLMVLRVAQATPTRPADQRPSRPGFAIVGSLFFAALVVLTGAWQ